jgi:hypothetical protein
VGRRIRRLHRTTSERPDRFVVRFRIARAERASARARRRRSQFAPSGHVGITPASGTERASRLPASGSPKPSFASGRPSRMLAMTDQTMARATGQATNTIPRNTHADFSATAGTGDGTGMNAAAAALTASTATAAMRANMTCRRADEEVELPEAVTLPRLLVERPAAPTFTLAECRDGRGGARTARLHEPVSATRRPRRRRVVTPSASCRTLPELSAGRRPAWKKSSVASTSTTS